MGNAEDLNTEECAWAPALGQPLETTALPGLPGSPSRLPVLICKTGATLSVRPSSQDGCADQTQSY